MVWGPPGRMLTPWVVMWPERDATWLFRRRFFSESISAMGMWMKSGSPTARERSSQQSLEASAKVVEEIGTGVAHGGDVEVFEDYEDLKGGESAGGRRGGDDIVVAVHDAEGVDDRWRESTEVIFGDDAAAGADLADDFFGKVAVVHRLRAFACQATEEVGEVFLDPAVADLRGFAFGEKGAEGACVDELFETVEMPAEFGVDDDAAVGEVNGMGGGVGPGDRAPFAECGGEAGEDAGRGDGEVAGFLVLGMAHVKVIAIFERGAGIEVEADDAVFLGEVGDERSAITG